LNKSHFEQKSFWTKVILNKSHFEQKSFWTKVIFYKSPFEQKSFYTKAIKTRHFKSHSEQVISQISFEQTTIVIAHI
jgi:hypothetical protein